MGSRRRVAPGLSAVPLRSPGASLRWLRGGCLTVSAPAPSVASGSGELAVGGARTAGGGGDSGGACPAGGVYRAAGPLSSPPPPPATGFRAVARALTHDPAAPLVSVASSRGTGQGGRGGGAAGARGGGPGQRLVVSGLRLSGAPAPASVDGVAPAVSPSGGGACPLVVRTARGSGGRSGSGARACRGVSRAVHPLPPPRVCRLGSRGPACWAPDHCRQACPSPVPPLATGLGLRRQGGSSGGSASG